MLALAILAKISLSPTDLISTFGLLGIGFIVFAESGLLVGFFLPGDSLLFLAGLYASTHHDKIHLHLVTLIPVVVIAAILGDQTGYVFGRKVGPSLFQRPDSRLFKQENVRKAQEYFDRKGPYTIFLARFVPIVRTFAPIVAGVGKMRYSVFLRWNILGGIAWGAGVILVGATIGKSFPKLEHYLLPISALIVVVSVIPVVLEYRRQKPAAK